MIVRCVECNCVINRNERSINEPFVEVIYRNCRNRKPGETFDRIEDLYQFYCKNCWDEKQTDSELIILELTPLELELMQDSIRPVIGISGKDNANALRSLKKKLEVSDS